MSVFGFAKMSGSGNDFILIDDRGDALEGQDLSRLARALCRRKFSVGADGLIVIRTSASADFGWRFFNADGSEAQMCGNGGRCAARFAFQKGICGPDLSFETGAGLVKAKVLEDAVMLGMTDPSDLREAETLDIDGETLQVWFANTGVPHAVIFSEDPEALDLSRLGPAIRRHRRFAPEGANANFARVTSGTSMKVRTYERGVEAETYACGTGATACAVIAASRGLVESPVRVTTSGGGVLTIHFTRDDDAFREVYLEGDARLIFEAEIGPDALISNDGRSTDSSD